MIPRLNKVLCFQLYWLIWQTNKVCVKYFLLKASEFNLWRCVCQIRRLRKRWNLNNHIIIEGGKIVVPNEAYFKIKCKCETSKILGSYLSIDCQSKVIFTGCNFQAICCGAAKKLTGQIKQQVTFLCCKREFSSATHLKSVPSLTHRILEVYDLLSVILWFNFKVKAKQLLFFGQLRYHRRF